MFLGLRRLLPEPALLAIATSALLLIRPSLAAQGATDAAPGLRPHDVLSRGLDGKVTVRAIPLEEPLRIDGRLNESIYQRIPPINGFIQQEPHEGQAATEDTDLWFFFDRDNLYIGARCWDSHPEREIANEMRRDHSNLAQDESLTFVFDTFHDRRTSFHFLVNRLGGVSDGIGTDERSYNGDWNTVWTVRTATFDRGWTIEWAIPFRSLRYHAGPDPVWGVNVRRNVRWKNEISLLSAIPAFLGVPGLMSMSLAATLVGLQVPPLGKNLDVKPYAIGGVRKDINLPSQGDKDVGLDVKYGITKSVTADVTYRTDFAQVEDDLQQVNLTRFSLFFPEKREFFLEGSGIFAFGGVGTSGGSIGPDSDPDDTPIPFFSRRIGLENGQPIPISLGGRITGKGGAYSFGAVAIGSEENGRSHAPATTFTAVRLKRDILRRSYVGGIYTRRSATGNGDRAGATYGLDTKYSISTRLNLVGFWARTEGLEKKGTSYLARADYNSDVAGVRAERMNVGAQFDPLVGFVRRAGITRDYLQGRYSPRPKRPSLRSIRKVTYRGSLATYANDAGERVYRDEQLELNLDFQTSDRFDVQYERQYEFIPQPFAISRSVVVPVGGYDYGSLKVAYQRGGQHHLSGWLVFERGSLYGGTKQRLEYKAGRIAVSSRFQIEPSISQNWIDLPWGHFLASVVSTRQTFSLSPRLFTSVLLQYNSSASTASTNVRLRWEYQPGSELFVVYNDGRDTRVAGFPTIQNRAFVVKINRLFRF